MYEKVKKYRRLIVILASVLPVMIALLCNHSFFSPLIDQCGSETIAYNYLNTGDSLATDLLSRVLCQVFAVGLAILFLYALWNWLLFLYYSWKSKRETRFYIYLLAGITFLGCLFVAFLYPLPISLSPDTYYNYTYAKEWLPMYWHGFLTNVVYCSCLIIIPHPLGMTLIPFIFAINLYSYFIYVLLIRNRKKGILFAILFTFFIFLMPETVQIFTFAGRNYMYGILHFTFLCKVLIDHIEQKPLTLKNASLLALLLAVLATWRTEGMLLLFFFPFLIYFAYLHPQKIWNVKKQWLQSLAIFFIFYCVFSFPVKYGDNKYQGLDYFIINLPGPVSVVLNDSDANLTYNRAQGDLDNIDSVVPLDYIKKYGEYGSINYNYDNQRAARQTNAGDKGKDFVISSYNLLFHNLDIYLKFQTNLFFQSLYLTPPFDVEYRQDDWNATPEGIEILNSIMKFYSVGQEDILVSYDLVIINSKLDAFMDNLVQYGYSFLLSNLYAKTGYVKLVVTLITFGLCIHSLIKKQWLYLFTGLALLGSLAVIILTAPTARNNYYFYPYFSQYWYIFIYLLSIQKKKV